MDDFKEEHKETKHDIFADVDMNQPQTATPLLLRLFVDRCACFRATAPSAVPMKLPHDADILSNFYHKLSHLLSLSSTPNILNRFYTCRYVELTPLKACLMAMHSFTLESHAYANPTNMFKQYWDLLVLFVHSGSNPAAKQDSLDYNSDGEYSFETLRAYLLPALYNVMSNEEEIMTRYMYVMTFGTERNQSNQIPFDPALFSVDYCVFTEFINIDVTLCGGAFASPLSGFSGDKLKHLQSPLTIYQLLQNGYVLMENVSNDCNVSTMINELFMKGNTDWIAYGRNATFVLYLWIFKYIYKEFRNGYQHLLNQCYIPLKDTIDDLLFDVFFEIMDFAIGPYSVLLNPIEETFFCTHAMRYFPEIPKKFQFWCINFILNKLSEDNLAVLKESIKAFSDSWPKLFARNYGSNKSDTKILLYLLKLYQGEFVHGSRVGDFHILLKRQCHNHEVVELLMAKKLKRLMINKSLLVQLIGMSNDLSEKSLTIILDKMHEEIQKDENDELRLSAALVGAFGVLCSDHLIHANAKDIIWKRLETILSRKYMKDSRWIDLSHVLDKIFENNQLLQFLMNKKLLNVDHCFKDVYKLKTALLNKHDAEHQILKITLNYLIENGENYKEELRLICIENQKIAMDIQNKPKCAECFRTCLSIL
eukprot:108739_1